MKRIKNFFVNIFKKYPVMIYFILANLLNEVVLRLLTIGSVNIRGTIFDLFIVFLFGSLSFLFKKKKKRNIYLISMTVFFTALCVMNSIYYEFYSSFLSASLLATSVYLKDVKDTVAKLVIKWTDFIYLWNIIGIILLLKKHEDTGKMNFKISTLVLVLLIGIGSALPPYYSYSRLIKLWNRVSVVDTFGVYVYQFDDLVQSLKPAINNSFGHDEALESTQEYYDSREDNVTTTNEYTDIFKGKNVLVIHAESLQSFTMNLSFEGKEVTPNLNKLASEGLYFSNFYSQVGVGTSSDAEFTFSTSLLPSNNGTVFVNYYNDTFSTIQKLMKQNNYYVFSMHGNNADFWNRERMHMNMGYDKFYSKSSFNIDETIGLGLSDKSFFSQVVPKIKEISESIDSPYYGTLITLSNHTPWSEIDNYTDYKVTMTKDNVTKDYLEGTTLGNYIKSVNYMDSSIGEFIDNLDKEGLLDNTVIVIYGDHDARISKSEYEYMYNYNYEIDGVDKDNYVKMNDYEYELNRSVPFIIWTKDMDSGKEIDTPMGMIDVLPTLGNMLGIYNKYSLGHDVFSIDEDDATVVFVDGSYLTNKIYYNAKNGEIYTLNNSVIDSKKLSEYVNSRAEYANKIIEVSNNIITYDLIKDLK